MNAFKILIDRLRSGAKLVIEELFDSTFLGSDEPELQFGHKVQVKGEAYLTDDHLIIHLSAVTQVRMPCAACNEMIDTPLKVENFYHTKPVEDISGAVFDYSEILREALLIELPKIVECDGGNCPNRAILKPYLKTEERSERTTYLPFSDVDKLN